MLAQAAAIASDPLAFLERMRGEYGPVVQFPLPRPPSYFVDDPSAIRRVLIGGTGFDKDTGAVPGPAPRDGGGSARGGR